MFASGKSTVFFKTMAYELNGTVKEIFDTQTFDSGFSKRAFVVTSEADKYPQDIQFECLKERIELVEKLKKGDKVTMKNVRSIRPGYGLHPKYYDDV